MIDIPMAKAMAKSLKKDLESHSISFPYSKCLEIVAHQFSKKDWNTFVGLEPHNEIEKTELQERTDVKYQCAVENLKRLMDALFANNYDVFMKGGTAHFKALVSRQNFEGVYEQVSVRNPNYKAIFLNELNQLNQNVFLWKILYDDESYDNLARLHLLEGKVEHFWLN